MITSLSRNIIIRLVMALFVIILLSGCHDSSSGGRAISEEASISNITLSTGTLSPKFDENTFSYAAQVPYNTTSVRVTVTAADALSRITVNGAEVNSGEASQPVNLMQGVNTITIEVTAEDNKTRNTYNIVVTRQANDDTGPASTNANLIRIRLSDGSLSPDFDSDITKYTAQVFEDSIKITPTAADTSATITVNGTEVISGFTSRSIDLALGLNTITIVITAEDETTTKTYTISVSRLAESSNANMSGIGLSSGVLMQTFNPTTTAYTAEISHHITSIKITPTAADPNAEITVNGTTVRSGSASQSIEILQNRNIPIVVTSQDETITRTYTLSVVLVSGFLFEQGGERINRPGVYSGSDAIPGARSDSISWTDSSGNLWLFGGLGYDEFGEKGFLNDLWRYNRANGTWSWISGSNEVDQWGGSAPGARDGSISWMDSSGNLWLFGGYGYDTTGNEGHLNDLWIFNRSTFTWSWVSGDNVADQAGVYGVMGVPDVENIPGSRRNSISWRDSSGNFWLFGGNGYDSARRLGYLNDLWRYNTNTREWTWMSGSNICDQRGSFVYPGARDGSVCWTDRNGNFWLFGGRGYASEDNDGYLNDLWSYNVSIGTWFLVTGSTRINQLGIYSDSNPIRNCPGSRWGSVSWIDSNGILWLLGGSGYGSINDQGQLNDLWKFDPSTMLWTWIRGNTTLTNQEGAYGPETATYIPGSRHSSISWIGSDNVLWFFGGYGFDEAGNKGSLNDLWLYE